MGAYHLNEDGQRLLQGIVPDGFLKAQGHGDPANPLSNRRNIIEHKTLASLLISIQERVRQVQRQSWRVARSLDARYPVQLSSRSLSPTALMGLFVRLSPDHLQTYPRASIM